MILQCVIIIIIIIIMTEDRRLKYKGLAQRKVKTLNNSMNALQQKYY